MKHIKPFINYNNVPKEPIYERHFTLSNMAGGLNNVEPDNEISDNESSDCMNMRFVNDSVMEKRYGSKFVENGNLFSCGDYNITLNELVWHKVNYSKKISNVTPPINYLDVHTPLLKKPESIVSAGGMSFIARNHTNDTVEMANIDGTILSGVSFNGKYYYVDGEDLRVYDGTECYVIYPEPVAHLTQDAKKNDKIIHIEDYYNHPAIKKDAPVFILSASLNLESNFNSTVEKVVYISNTNKYEITLKDPLPGDMIKNAPVFFYKPAEGKNIVGKEVWNKSQRFAYYEPCLLELADNFAGESYLPNKPSVITVHNNRLFISGDTKQPHGVYMSRTLQPLYFPSGAGLAVKPDGQEVVDMVVFDNTLVIGRKTDMYVLHGNSEYQNTSTTAYSIKQMDVSCGFMNRNCGAFLNNYYIFLGSDGRFYKLNTPTTFVEYLMTSPLPNKCDVYSKPINITNGSKLFLSTTAYKNEVWFSIYESKSKNVVVVYNYDNMSFTYYTGLNSRFLKKYDDRLYIGNDNNIVTYYDDISDSHVYYDCSDFIGSDVINAYECRYYTKRFDLGDSIVFKYFKQFLLTTHAFGESVSSGVLQNNVDSSIKVQIEVDYVDLDIFENIVSNISRFDKAHWNVDYFNNKNLFKTRYYYIDIRGRTIMFKFSNNVKGETMRIYDVSVVYGGRDIR